MTYNLDGDVLSSIDPDGHEITGETPVLGVSAFCSGTKRLSSAFGPLA
jgi:hypothetical protein